MLSIFSCACWLSVHLLRRNVRSFAHFSIGLLAFLLLSCYLYSLEIKPLSVASFETIFSHSVSCLFFFLFPLLCKSLSVWLCPNGLFLLFISVALGEWPEKTFVRMCCLFSLPGVWRWLVLCLRFFFNQKKKMWVWL